MRRERALRRDKRRTLVNISPPPQPTLLVHMAVDVDLRLPYSPPGTLRMYVAGRGGSRIHREARRAQLVHVSRSGCAGGNNNAQPPLFVGLGP